MCKPNGSGLGGAGSGAEIPRPPMPAPPPIDGDALPRLDPIDMGYSRVVEAISHVDQTVVVDTTYNAERFEPLLYAVSLADGTLAMADSVLHQNRKLIPPECKKAVKDGMVLFPSHPEDYGNDRYLNSLIRRYIRNYLDVPKFWEDLILTFVKMTWVFDRFNAVPFLRFMGTSGGGKTRMGSMVARICYKAIMGGVSITAAAMFRMTDQYGGVLFVDEADFRASDMTANVVQALNAGYRRDGIIARCDKDNEVEIFKVFGPKILTTRKRFGDNALESRCLTLEVSEKTVRDDIRCHISDEYKEDSLHLRNKLLAWRLKNYRNIVVDEQELHGHGLDPRIIEIGTPLISVCGGDKKFLADFIKFAGKSSKERREEDPAAFVVGGIQHLLGALPQARLSIKDVAQAASKLRRQEEPQAAIDVMHKNSQGEEPQYFSSKRTGMVVRSLGFVTERTKWGYEFEVRADRLAELVERYSPPAMAMQSDRVGMVS